MRGLRGGRGGAARGLRRDRGQVTIEFLGMTPLILLTLVLLWQCALLGYTFTLAANSADMAARAGTAAEDRQGACQAAGLEHLPGAWTGGAKVTCGESGGLVTADVHLKVPVLFPGTIAFPFEVDGHAGAVVEEGD
ncbi:TadE/TadG family type IV pilus assembly protein [Streptomyces sp. DI166]